MLWYKEEGNVFIIINLIHHCQNGKYCCVKKKFHWEYHYSFTYNIPSMPWIHHSPFSPPSLYSKISIFHKQNQPVREEKLTSYKIEIKINNCCNKMNETNIFLRLRNNTDMLLSFISISSPIAPERKYF